MNRESGTLNALCTICARGGSKGVPDKNIQPMLGVPLIAYTIRAALESKIFSEIAVSSDSAKILAVAKEYGATLLIKRPLQLANDTVAKIPAIRHCMLQAEKAQGTRFDICVDLAVTSPLRLPHDICDAVDLLVRNPGSNVVSACEAQSSPYFNLVEETSEGYATLSKKPANEVVRRQDAPSVFELNGSVYGWHRESLLKTASVIEDRTIIYKMPHERSLDIDTPFDWELVTHVLSRSRSDTP